MKIAIVIPARLASTRLKRKPLEMIGTKPMVVHVAERAATANVGDVFVACCGEEIARVVTQHGFRAIITDPALPSGTDRVFAATQLVENAGGFRYEFVVNVQGDMPFISPEVIASTLSVVQHNEYADIATPVTPIHDEHDYEDRDVVKAIISSIDMRAMYFTRAPIKNTYKHLGLYAYRRRSLERFVHLPISTLEKAERLEQLRALEHGMAIFTTFTKDDSISIDTQENLECARLFYAKHQVV